MANIKCRYYEFFCGCKDNYWYGDRAKLCSVLCPKCTQEIEDIVINEGNKCTIISSETEIHICDEVVIECREAYADVIEFEKTVKNYNYNNATKTLTIGKIEYPYIQYLEIDGRILIDRGDEN